ncbi:hypothetical protein TNCV_4413271 [Trichonephila clavipes]|nr:hypothetical protein TNCV_4413271 [Trichonephila clavipes]
MDERSIFDSGDLVVKFADSWLACHEFDPSTAEDVPCKRSRSMLSMSRLKRPSVGVGKLRCHPRHLTRVENNKYHCQKPT